MHKLLFKVSQSLATANETTINSVVQKLSTATTTKIRSEFCAFYCTEESINCLCCNSLQQPMEIRCLAAEWDMRETELLQRGSDLCWLFHHLSSSNWSLIKKFFLMLNFGFLVVMVMGQWSLEISSTSSESARLLMVVSVCFSFFSFLFFVRSLCLCVYVSYRTIYDYYITYATQWNLTK